MCYVLFALSLVSGLPLWLSQGRYVLCVLGATGHVLGVDVDVDVDVDVGEAPCKM
jgi:hypothetical protein